MKKPTVLRLLMIAATISLLICVSSASAALANSPTPLEGPEIILLSAPQWIEIGSLFKVAVTARNAKGISAIEIGFDGQIQRFPVRNEKTASVVAEFAAQSNDAGQVTAVAISSDGQQRSITRGQQIMSGIERPARATQTADDFRKRLGDIDYVARTGALKNQNWPIDVVKTPWWNAWFEQNGPKPFDWKNKCAKTIQGIDAYGLVLECWLTQNPQVAASIVWQQLDPNAGPVDKYNVHIGVTTDLAYAHWTPEMKQQLHFAVFYAWEWMHGGLNWFNGNYLPPAPDNQLMLQDHEGNYTILSHDDAWNLYLGTIAQSLAVELGGFVPWSVSGYNGVDLAVLFDSRLMFTAKNEYFWPQPTVLSSATGYWVPNMIPAPPTQNFQFMVAQDIIRPDHYRSIGRYLFWGRYNVTHTGDFTTTSESFTDGDDGISAQAYWNYRGTTPASQIIDGTTLHDPLDPSWVWPIYFSPFSHWIQGCHDMSYFTQQLLRAVNIPVQVADIGKTGHGTPFFWTIGYTMSHGDDMYDGNNIATPAFPGEWLLIPMATYNDWIFGSDVLGPNGYANVGRQADIEVPLKSLPNTLLQAYCADNLSNATHANGKVAAFFRRYVDNENITYYTVPQLESMGIWTKLGTKAEALGLCGQ